jgi:hypothetical protein
MYITPPKMIGFDSHFDDHDVFVMQLQGSKRWYVWDHAPVEYPIKEWGNTRLKPVRKEMKKRAMQPMINTILHPGDLLYLPRGYMHQANCRKLEETSYHLSLGLFATTYGAYLQAVFEDLAVLVHRKSHPELTSWAPGGFITALAELCLLECDSVPALRRALPLGFLSPALEMDDPTWAPLKTATAALFDIAREKNKLAAWSENEKEWMVRPVVWLAGAVRIASEDGPLMSYSQQSVFFQLNLLSPSRLCTV